MKSIEIIQSSSNSRRQEAEHLQKLLVTDMLAFVDRVLELALDPEYLTESLSEFTQDLVDLTLRASEIESHRNEAVALGRIMKD